MDIIWNAACSIMVKISQEIDLLNDYCEKNKTKKPKCE